MTLPLGGVERGLDLQKKSRGTEKISLERYEPHMQIARIRLSDKTSRFHPTARRAQARSGSMPTCARPRYLRKIRGLCKFNLDVDQKFDDLNLPNLDC